MNMKKTLPSVAIAAALSLAAAMPVQANPLARAVVVAGGAVYGGYLVGGTLAVLKGIDQFLWPTPDLHKAHAIFAGIR